MIKKVSFFIYCMSLTVTFMIFCKVAAIVWWYLITDASPKKAGDRWEAKRWRLSVICLSSPHELQVEHKTLVMYEVIRVRFQGQFSEQMWKSHLQTLLKSCSESWHGSSQHRTAPCKSCFLPWVHNINIDITLLTLY